MASNGQTIDSIKVGLGVDFGALSSDIKAAQARVQRDFVIKPKFGTITVGQIDSHFRDLQKAVNDRLESSAKSGKGAKPIKIPVQLGATAASLQKDLDSLLGGIDIKPITIPVRFAREQGPGLNWEDFGPSGSWEHPGGGGGPQTGPRGGRRGRRATGPQATSEPARPAASSGSSSTTEEEASPQTGRRSRRQPGGAAGPASGPPPPPSGPPPRSGAPRQAAGPLTEEEKAVNDLMAQVEQLKKAVAEKERQVANIGGTGAQSGQRRVTTESRPAGASPVIDDVSWDKMRGFVDSQGNVIQNLQGETKRSRRDPDKVARERNMAVLLGNAVKSGDVSGIDQMFPAKVRNGQVISPGLGTALANRSPGQVRAAFANAMGLNAQRAGRRLGGFGSEKSGTQQRMEEYPLDFLVSGLMSALNMDTRPTAMRVGGVAAVAGGTTGRQPTDAERVRSVEREARDPSQARKEIGSNQERRRILARQARALAEESPWWLGQGAASPEDYLPQRFDMSLGRSRAGELWAPGAKVATKVTPPNIIGNTTPEKALGYGAFEPNLGLDFAIAKREAQSAVTTYERAQRQHAALGSSLHANLGPPPTPDPVPFAVLDEQAKEQAARAAEQAKQTKAYQKLLRDPKRMPIRMADEESLDVGPMSWSANKRPWDIETRRPITGTMHELIAKRFGMMDKGGTLAQEMARRQGRHPATLGMSRQAADDAISVTRVGEAGEEAIVEKSDGSMFVVPNPHLNEFTRRLMEKRLAPKDFTGMAGGGGLTGKFKVAPVTVGGADYGQHIGPVSPGPEYHEGGFSPFSSFRFGPSFSGPTSKIHVSAIMAEAQKTLEIVHDVAKQMGVEFKYVRNLEEIGNPADNPPFGMRPQTFGPGGSQQGKFITAYPRPDQGKEMAERLHEALTKAGLGKTAAVAPTERRYSPDSPITHRYVPDITQSGSRYATDGGYNEPGAVDYIGTYTPKPKSRRAAAPLSTPPPGAGSDPRFSNLGNTGLTEDGTLVPLMDPDAAIWGPDDNERRQAWKQNPRLYRGRGGKGPGKVAKGMYVGGRPTSLNPQNPLNLEPPEDIPPAPPEEPPVARRRPRAHDWRIGGGPRGRFRFTGRAGQEILESQQGGTISGHGEVQRVYVVNFPEMRTTSGRLGGTPLFQNPAAQGAPRGGRVHAPVAPPPGATPPPGTPPPGGGGGGQQPVATGPSQTQIKGATGRNTTTGSLAKLEGLESVSSFSERLDRVGTDISEALQKSPVRALSVAMGQIAQTVVGGRAGILERAGMARAARGRAGIAVGELAAAEEQVIRGNLEIATGTKMFGVSNAVDAAQIADAKLAEKATSFFENAEALVAGGRERAEAIRPIAEEKTAEAEKAAKGILSPFQQVKAQAVGLGGIVGGTILFTAAMHASQMAMEQFAVVASNAVDAFDGFGFTARRVTEEFATAITKASGNIEGAVAGITARTGLPAGIDMSALTERAALQAGAAQVQQQRDLFRSQQWSEGIDERMAVPGIGVGFNNGLFGTWINQQQGIVEQMAGQLSGIKFPGPQPAATTATTGRTVFAGGIPESIADYRAGVEMTAARNSGTLGPRMPAFVFELPAATDMEDFKWKVGLSDQDLKSMSDEAISKQIISAQGVSAPAGSDLEKRLFGYEKKIAGQGYGPLSTNLLPPELGELTQWNLANADATAKLNKQLELWNGQLEKAESTYRYEVVGAGKEEEFQRTLRQAGAGPAQQAAFRDANVALVAPSGDVASARGLNRELANALKAAIKPTFEDLLIEMERPFQAQIGAIYRGAEVSRQTEIPTDFFTNLIANPPPGMVGRPWTTGITAPGVGGMEGRIGGAYGQRIQQTYEGMAPFIEKGRQELISLGQTEAEQAAIEKEIGAVERLGASITNLQARSSNLQLGLEQAQYNEQLYLSERSLSDILGIMGKTGAQTSELGRLQRAQIMDSRELSRIQLARSQRELNLQLALSKLRAPGETAEERAVRRREAQIQVNMQQRELDIGKRTTFRGFGIEDIGYARQARDLGVQIRLMKEARQISIEVRGIENLKAAKQQLLGVKTAMLGVSRSVGVAVIQAGNSIITSLETELGPFTRKMVRIVNRWATDTIEAAANLRESFGTTTPTEETDNTKKTKRRSGGQAYWEQTGRGTEASGGMFIAHTPTRFVAGDAGTEQVVVIRNPRAGSFSGSGMQATSGGGGGVSISLVLNATVRGEADETRLAHKVAKALHREAAILVGA